jgi:hypothetical protein
MKRGKDLGQPPETGGADGIFASHSSGQKITSAVPDPILNKENPLAITDGEAHFIWGLTRDGAVGANVWRQLMGSWGFCERHAWVTLSVEMSLLHGFCLRSADLYVHLLQQGIAALARGTSSKKRLLPRQLADHRRCLICECNPRSRGRLSDARLAKAKDFRPAKMFVEALAPIWQINRCPRCIDVAANGHFCRRHLIETLKAGSPINFEHEHRYLSNLLPHVENYYRSFSWGHRNSDSPEDRVAFLSSIGWCSGWSSLAILLDARRVA